MKDVHLLRRAVNTMQLLLGVALAALPGFVVYIENLSVAYNTVAAGAAAAAVALVAFVTQWRWLPWLTGGISLWVLAASLALGFDGAEQTLWGHLALGCALLATALADWACVDARSRNEHA